MNEFEGSGGGGVPSLSSTTRFQAASLKGFINNITQSSSDASVEILLVDEDADSLSFYNSGTEDKRKTATTRQ